MDKERINLKTERVKEYFVDAAQEILRGEGFPALTVRNLSARAGYSSTTFYGYFENISDIIYLCLERFSKECKVMVEDAVKNKKINENTIKTKCIEFVKFFIQYPGIFELFYTSNIRNLNNNKSSIELINNLFLEIVDSDFKELLNNKEYKTSTEIKQLEKHLISTLLGLMLLYINRRIPNSYMEFNKLLKEQIDRCFV